MSAFQLSDKHLLTLVGIAQALHREGRGCDLDGASPFDEEAVFNKLARENARSVDYRYGGESTEPVPYTRQRVPVVRLDTLEGVAAAMKAIDCYTYQSCEHPEWEGSKVRGWCDRMSRDLLHSIPRFSAAYGAAPWSI